MVTVYKGPVVDHEIKRKRQEFAHGNGCKRHDNCLTCPFKDCKAPACEFIWYIERE
jgi:hypothetical protein